MKQVIAKTEEFVKREMYADSTGHDWFHIDRVRNMALQIHEKEKVGDPFIIELAALLHDISDEKLHISKEEGEKKLTSFLSQLPLDEWKKNHIKEIIETISFKGGNNRNITTIEAAIVQDADRLDAIGAIGIARAFAYGGKKGQPIYDPTITVRSSMTNEEYRKGHSSSINHFYEKLLKLKEKMNTKSGSEIAERRHAYMEDFLHEFYNDWNGKRQ
ncbi:HD domain-containing protein [Robertmurraya korlensis]|uniref:HD domain-containing protein n=1 Tax=Robertmurraya korlensis TaxID=519977 RepID=UPI00203E31F2|nr:HD domain-containing protein [Robertmurraya korlensis]MCM3599877.1 HD domain-containing protein [Robertmurraya korlensis]